MHDCFGKRIKPFDRVRAATREELDTHGHTGDPAEVLSPAERVVVSGNEAAMSCNVTLVAAVRMPAFLLAPDGGGTAMFAFEGGVGYATAYKLVRLD